MQEKIEAYKARIAELTAELGKDPQVEDLVSSLLADLEEAVQQNDKLRLTLLKSSSKESRMSTKLREALNTLKRGDWVNRSMDNKKRRKPAKPVVKYAKAGVPPPKLSPQQIAIIAGLLNNFFVVESVLYNRDNELKVVLTSRTLTNLPVLGNPEYGLVKEDIVLDIIASETDQDSDQQQNPVLR
ncbi:hypothetical protein BGX30_001867 [Mortierella sp. GBA39]|nr:hypothetical protein BGX30_001867 [Mortierella sp. GBA39]